MAIKKMILYQELFDLPSHWLIRGRLIDIVENDKYYTIIQAGVFKDNGKSIGRIPISNKQEVEL